MPCTGLWAAAGAGYFYGAETTLNSEKQNDRRELLARRWSLGYPITPQLGLKVFYLGTRKQEPTVQDTDSIGAASSVFW